MPTTSVRRRTSRLRRTGAWDQIWRRDGEGGAVVVRAVSRCWPPRGVCRSGAFVPDHIGQQPRAGRNGVAGRTPRPEGWIGLRVLQRCQGRCGAGWPIAATRPAWASPVTSVTIVPRATRSEERQPAGPVLSGGDLMPRSPVKLPGADAGGDQVCTRRCGSAT